MDGLRRAFSLILLNRQTVVTWIMACLVGAETLVAMQIVLRPSLLWLAYGLVIALPQAVILRRLGVQPVLWVILTACGGAASYLAAIFTTLYAGATLRSLITMPALLADPDLFPFAANVAFAIGGLTAGAVLGLSQLFALRGSGVMTLWVAGSTLAGPFAAPLAMWLVGFPLPFAPLLALAAAVAYGPLTALAVSALRARAPG